MGSSGPEPLPLVDLSAALDAVQVGLQIIDRDWRYLYLNRTAAEHGRRPREELIGHTMEECYPGIESTDLFAGLRRVMDHGATLTVETRFTFPSGDVGWFEIRAEFVPQGLLVLSIDVTQRRALEGQLRHAQKMEMLGLLAGGLAHDFNNLLTIILASAEFAASHAAPDWPGLQELQQIMATVHRGAALTRQLLAFSSGAPSQPSPVVLDDVLNQLDPMLRRLLGAGIDLVTLPGAGDTATLIDPSQLEQVVVNLAVNARDAMPGGGKLTLESALVELTADTMMTRMVTVPPGQYVALAVTDTGTGMTPEVMERIFDPFFTTKQERGGSGLGLATSWGIVRRAGGYLWPYSEIRHGTTFRVYLPVTAEEVTAVPKAPATTALRGHEHVLVVEDDPRVRDVTLRSLAHWGYRTSSASTVAEALGHAAQVDMVLLDWVLPDGVAAEIVSEVRRTRPGLPVVYMSGYAPGAVARLLPDDGLVLEKPFGSEALAAKIREALGDPSV